MLRVTTQHINQVSVLGLFRSPLFSHLAAEVEASLTKRSPVHRVFNLPSMLDRLTFLC